MKSRLLLLAALAVMMAGCATDSELSQKEKDRINREQEREAQKQQKAQEKMMREAGSGQQRTRMR